MLRKGGATYTIPKRVSVSVHILANNALRAHHASAHGGLSANGLSDICLSFFELILLSTCWTRVLFKPFYQSFLGVLVFCYLQCYLMVFLF